MIPVNLQLLKLVLLGKIVNVIFNNVFARLFCKLLHNRMFQTWLPSILNKTCQSGRNWYRKKTTQLFWTTRTRMNPLWKRKTLFVRFNVRLKNPVLFCSRADLCQSNERLPLGYYQSHKTTVHTYVHTVRSVVQTLHSAFNTHLYLTLVISLWLKIKLQFTEGINSRNCHQFTNLSYSFQCKPTMNTAFMLLLSASLFLTWCYAAQIQSLPGYAGKVNFKQYSGYFNVSQTHHLHYWYVSNWELNCHL